ncbi:MAG: succinate dehydrogenase iron-sulfur subunit [Nitrospinae bacterium]|nr:succinate dehydrogenase iron-sulfur subunit [Nitrospinota bacterium]
MKTKFKIRRFDPQKDQAPRFQEYELEVPQGATLLDCVNLIKWTQDGTLSYRMSCRSAICGSCAMKVNGHARLACKTQAKDVIKNNLVVLEPLGNMTVIKDLAVDLEPFWEKVEKVMPWLVNDEEVSPGVERLQSPEDFHKIDAASTCIMCASCFSDCCSEEVDKEYLGPTALAKAQRFVCDSRDKKQFERISKLSKEKGIWDCTHCGECSQRCPTDAKPLERIVELRNVALNSGVLNNNGARHAKAFVDSIAKSGRLNENELPVKSMGFFNIKGLLEILPVGIRMLIRGKNPPLIHHSIEDMDQVKKIFREFGEPK